MTMGSITLRFVNPSKWFAQYFGNEAHSSARVDVFWWIGFRFEWMQEDYELHLDRMARQRCE